MKKTETAAAIAAAAAAHCCCVLIIQPISVEHRSLKKDGQ